MSTETCVQTWAADGAGTHLSAGGVGPGREGPAQGTVVVAGAREGHP